MQITYIKSQSSVRPELIDTTSSKKYVYLRQNVVEHSNGINEETYTYYEYEEAKLTKVQYEQYLQELSLLDIQQQRADIDYIALMTGITLEV